MIVCVHCIVKHNRIIEISVYVVWTVIYPCTPNYPKAAKRRKLRQLAVVDDAEYQLNPCAFAIPLGLLPFADIEYQNLPEIHRLSAARNTVQQSSPHVCFYRVILSAIFRNLL